MIRDNRLSDAEYAQNFSDIHPPFETRDAALVDANRCLYCYDAPCTKSCPTGIDVPRFIKQIVTDNVKGSAHTIFQSNIMGGGCARVCPVEKLCEGACVYNLMEETPIPIARLQRYATEKAIREKWPLFQRSKPTGKKVAIVGAGPSGLSAAHVLARAGVDVTIYEKEQKGGGLMTYGVAAYKITPEFCAEELDYILSIGGIAIRYEQQLGRNLQLSHLRQQYDAVYLAFGVGLARRLDIPGEDLEGVVDAIRFIWSIRAEGYPATPVGDRVAVIGMGMTAIDAATQARRLGAKEVTLVYRRTQAEMPCTETELDIAKLDGCNIIWLAAPKSVLGAGGRVTQLLCSVMEPGPPDASGRRRPVDTGRTITLDVDMVIKAAGQMPYETLVADETIAHDKGRVSIDSNGATNIPGVFAGGDNVNGGKEVVDAVQAGKDAAAAILSYINN
ncbi:NAD(P)-dependent oxidoreductase [Puia dinghuensis]|uniref:Dihydropyrimidine dehydrogenase subunit A n=1 Tax=Puia dinghuensis TaxID=1792502 RepID=A0A8J2XQ79_9BACT|nr:NAD(P)-dependent oxidoreductase [Puia dinghuensis]GGA83969.1 dihydropyrimidine dehydrogenase subunit A [Puia dinghuensis]